MIANLSIDLDNKWSYLKTAEKLEWKERPSYFPMVVPRIISHLARANLTVTTFVVGRDLDTEENRLAVLSLANAGHTLANHSLEHHSWLSQLPVNEIRSEIETAHDSIRQLVGYAPIGFRGPSYSDSPEIHEVLLDLQYRYCASSFPSSVGPLARAYYLLKTGLRASTDKRSQLFGKWSDMIQSNRPHPIEATLNRLWMFPVTVQPITRLPFHFTYLFFLSGYSMALGRAYFRYCMMMCRLFRIAPSLLLHPLDFLGGDEEPDLSFFPGMKLEAEAKLKQLDWFLKQLSLRWRMLSMEQHLDLLLKNSSDDLTHASMKFENPT